MNPKVRKINFYTKESWKSVNSSVPVRHDPNLHEFEWDYVGFEFQAYYFHVHLNANCKDKNILKEYILCIRIERVLEILSFNCDSAVSIMVPGWITRSKPAICEVSAIHISIEPGISTYIAECTNKKLYALHLDPEPQQIKLSKVKKKLVWHQNSEINPLRLVDSFFTFLT